MASESAGCTPVEIRAARHAPAAPAYGRVNSTRAHYVLRFPDGFEARELARPAGGVRLLAAEMRVPRLEEPHLTDEEAEDFVRNALSDSALAGAEEHLLLCEPCRRRVEALDRFVAALRPAARRPSLWTWFRPRRTLPCR